MANNVNTGPNSRVAIASVSFEDMGLNESNTNIVYEVEGGYKSWKPGRFINPIVASAVGKGYVLIQKEAMDLTPYFAPPMVGVTSFRYVVPQDGIVNI